MKIQYIFVYYYLQNFHINYYCLLITIKFAMNYALLLLFGIFYLIVLLI